MRDRHTFERMELAAIRRLDRIRSDDNEGTHAAADAALLDFVRNVSEDVAAAFERCAEANKPWWYA